MILHAGRWMEVYTWRCTCLVYSTRKYRCRLSKAVKIKGFKIGTNTVECALIANSKTAITHCCFHMSILFHVMKVAHLARCLISKTQFYCRNYDLKFQCSRAGPNTIVGLSKQQEGVSFNASKAVQNLLPAYVDLLKSLKNLGVPEVQIHEPILTTHTADKLQSDFEATYKEFSKIGLPIDLVTYYDDIGSTFSWVTKLPVQVSISQKQTFHPFYSLILANYSKNMSSG